MVEELNNRNVGLLQTKEYEKNITEPSLAPYFIFK